MKLYLFVTVVTAIILFTFGRINSILENDLIAYGSYSDDMFSSTEDRVEVSISGEVQFAGNYFIATPATLRHLVEAAGGLSDDADATCFNLDINLINKESYYIPKIAEGKLSLNNATLVELTGLPGIGLTYGERIIEYREWNQGFAYLDEIKKVQGIGVATFDKIKDLICL